VPDSSRACERGPLGSAVLDGAVGIERRDVRADDLAGPVTEHRGRAAIPAFDVAVRVESEQRVSVACGQQQADDAVVAHHHRPGSTARSSAVGPRRSFDGIERVDDLGVRRLGQMGLESLETAPAARSLDDPGLMSCSARAV